MFEEYKDIYVIADRFEGQVRNVTIELIGQARKIADALNQNVSVMVLGHNVQEDQNKELIGYGADTVYVFDDPFLERYNTDGYAKVITEFFSTHKPNAILIGATNDGRDLAPRISGRMRSGVVADCTILSVDTKDGLVEWTRPALGGNILAEIICPEHRPQMGTVRPAVFKKPEFDASRQGNVEHVPVNLTAEDIRSKFIEMIKENRSTVNLEEAEFVIAGGRGMGNVSNFNKLQELADVLGGVVGATRPLVEMGWVDLSRQIGQTGRMIAPKIYICFGVSGAIQHVAGIGGSELIIAVNSDPEAPIFKTCDFGIVGDVMEILPKMVDAFKAHPIK